MKEILFLLLLSLTANFTQSADCYWRKWPHCGLIPRCGKDIFIQYGFKGLCVIGPAKYCCPRGAGNNLMLCEDSNFKGHCISHSVEEHKCVNVDKTYWASSVDTFDSCFRFYNNRDCTGKSIAVYPGLDGTKDLAKLGFNDQVVSVSNCFKADREADHCKRSKRWADGKCQWFTDVATIGFLAWLRRDTTNLQGPVRYYQQAQNGRTEVMEALVERRHLNTGTGTNPRSRQYARSMGRNNDDAGHILAQRLGGSGTDTRNIFPQTPNINRGVWSEMEDWVVHVVNNHGSALFTVNLEYENDSATRPTRIIFRICRGDTGALIYMGSMVNP